MKTRAPSTPKSTLPDTDIKWFKQATLYLSIDTRNLTQKIRDLQVRNALINTLVSKLFNVRACLGIYLYPLILAFLVKLYIRKVVCGDGFTVLLKPTTTMDN